MKPCRLVLALVHGLERMVHLLELLRGAPHRSGGAGQRLQHLPDLEQPSEEAVIDADLQMPIENVGIEHVPVVAIQNLRADLGLRLDQALRRQGLQGFAQGSARNAVQLHQLRVARQDAADGKAALHDVLVIPWATRSWADRVLEGLWTPLNIITLLSNSTVFATMPPTGHAAAQ